METKAILKNVYKDYLRQEVICEFVVSETTPYKFEEKIGKQVKIAFDDSKKRSLNANAYLWKLCTLIAEKIQSDKDSVYKLMLSQYGQYTDIDCDKSSVARVKALFRYFEEFNEDFITEYDRVTIRGYFGSSTYNTNEMSILLDGVTREARDLGIPLISDEEMDRLLNTWQPKGEK